MKTGPNCSALTSEQIDHCCRDCTATALELYGTEAVNQAILETDLSRAFAIGKALEDLDRQAASPSISNTESSAI